jgi:hypothetical protein
MEGAATARRKNVKVTNADVSSSTTIGLSTEAWIINEFVGQYVTLTGGTGSGQSRRITSNTATTLTVSPAFSTTPDSTSDFEIDSESLYGASNIVTAIGVNKRSLLGEARRMCVGTNDAADGGGMMCYNGPLGTNIISDLYHADTEKTDDAGNEWTGGDYDDIRSIDLIGNVLIAGSEAHLFNRTEDSRIVTAIDYLANQLFNVRQELVQDGITLTGSLGTDVGGGADLAEYYYANEALEPGDVVAIDPSQPAGITMSSASYQTNLLGIVSTSPGITLGPDVCR